MEKSFFEKGKLYLMDGAMGTMVQAAGLNTGELSEIYNITHPDIIENIHRAYIDAGSDIITTNTFSANEIKLAALGLKVEEVVTRAVKIARKAAEDKLVALDIGPIGQLMYPAGELTFGKAYDIVARQAKAGQEAGADLVIIETLSDIYEAKAAILAVKENTSLPVICTLTFDQSGRTMMGTDPLTVVSVLEGLGVDALGLNCSLGPNELVPIVDQLLKYAHIPVIVQPNAGLPQVINGKSVYTIEPSEFARTVISMVKKGVQIVGGCCGTTPDYIKALREELDKVSPGRIENKHLTCVSSSRQTVVFNDRFTIIGQRINPSGKPGLKEAIKQKDFEIIYDEAFNQISAGANILDINGYVEGTNEAENLKGIITSLQQMVRIPLAIDSADPAALEEGARLYNGKPLISSVNGSEESMDRVFPIVKKYGGTVVAMTFDDKGIPTSPEDRLAVAKKIIEAAEGYGIAKHDIILDCLVLSHKRDRKASWNCLKALGLIKEELDAVTVLGISNISYGFDARQELNSLFLSMALNLGLDAAILDPTEEMVTETINAYKGL